MMKKTVLMLFVLFPLCFPANQSSAYLVDTGPGTGLPGFDFYNDGSQFVYAAGEFTLGESSTITGIDLWMSIKKEGNLTFKIYQDGGDIPGTTTLYSQSGSFTVDSTPAWKGVGGVNWSLGPGTYWVAFEAQPAFHAYVPWNSNLPLVNEANWISINNGVYYKAYDFLKIGVRIEGSAVPLPGAVLLLGAGLGRLVLYSRRKLADKN